MKRVGFFAGLLLALGISFSAYALGTGDGYYVTFDDFAMINTSNPDTTLVSPYDSVELGGFGNCGTITDISENAAVEAKRDFNRVDGICTVELCFSTADPPDGATLNFRCKDINAITVLCEKGEFFIMSKEGKTELTGINNFYGLRAIVDIDNKTYSLQSNGITIGSNFGFLNDVEYLDNFYVSTSDEGTGTISLEAMRISKDFSINEWFIASRQNVPDDWKKLGDGVSLVRMNSSLLNDRYSMQITDNDFTEETGVSHELSYDSDELWFEFQFFLPQQVKDFGATLRSDGKDIFRFGTKNLNYGYWLNNEFTSVYTLRTNLWYHAMLKITKDGTKLYINHKLVADNIPLEQAKIDSIRLTIGKAATGSVCIDDIIAKAIHPLPEDYVPAPVKPEKKNPETIIGMQSCDLWREGTHFGWDSISAYPERKTYLGFYDEGSSEVKDWETKWMVEHGIDVEIYCWYRQSASNTEPIKRPRNSFALHEGYFNGEYSDQMKFVISWENGGRCGGPEDFETNMVPYWIEQYFKDDRYFKIDNKPVVGFYNFDNLVKDFGSVEGVKKELDYLESECIKAGFDGVECILTSSTKNETTLQNFKDVGIDALYCYSWGYSSYITDVQKNGMNSQLETGILDIIPTITMGYDVMPWERDAGGILNKESLIGLLKWARDDFMPRSGRLGQRFITLDNWNEFGEGHWFYPSNYAGFDYLDAVREVFTEGKEHEDIKPTENQKARVNHLYVQSRAVEKTFTAKEYYKSLENTNAGDLGYELSHDDENVCVVVDSNTYLLAAEMDDSRVASIKVGNAYTFYLDACGRISAGMFKSLSNGEMDWVYLIDIKNDDSEGETDLYFKILTKSGKVTNIKCADRIKIDGVSYKSTKTTEIKERFTQNDIVLSQALKLSVDDDGYINNIDTIYMNAEKENKSETVRLLGNADIARRWRSSLMTFDADFVLGSNAVIFVVPAGLANKANKGDNSDYGVATTDIWRNDSEVKVAAYNSNVYSRFAEAVVTTDSRTVSADKQDYVTVVSDLIQTIDEDDNAAVLIKGIQGSTEISKFAADEKELTVNGTKIEIGDIIRYGVDYEGRIKDIELYFDAGEKKYIGSQNLYNSWSDFQTGVAKAYRIEDGYLTVEADTTLSPDDQNGKKVTIKANPYKVIEVDMSCKKPTVTKSTLSAVKDWYTYGNNCSYMFMQNRYYDGKTLVIYKY